MPYAHIKEPYVLINEISTKSVSRRKKEVHHVHSRGQPKKPKMKSMKSFVLM